ncbi:hypothetical protein AB6A40_003224 [Gnathostoma spinigerum]|uniref:Transforming acidic coiled-coil-containing protein C-terminal domain-containing protein n=1 Tax=Gnathostoma spinigerum TaxID=75299 RepID=A0ABD6EJQ8_9BILA
MTLLASTPVISDSGNDEVEPDGIVQKQKLESGNIAEQAYKPSVTSDSNGWTTISLDSPTDEVKPRSHSITRTPEYLSVPQRCTLSDDEDNAVYENVFSSDKKLSVSTETIKAMAGPFTIHPPLMIASKQPQGKPQPSTKWATKDSDRTTSSNTDVSDVTDKNHNIQQDIPEIFVGSDNHEVPSRETEQENEVLPNAYPTLNDTAISLKQKTDTTKEDSQSSAACINPPDDVRIAVLRSTVEKPKSGEKDDASLETEARENASMKKNDEEKKSELTTQSSVFSDESQFSEKDRSSSSTFMTSFEANSERSYAESSDGTVFSADSISEDESQAFEIKKPIQVSQIPMSNMWGHPYQQSRRRRKRSGQQTVTKKTQFAIEIEEAFADVAKMNVANPLREAEHRIQSIVARQQKEWSYIYDQLCLKYTQECDKNEVVERKAADRGLLLAEYEEIVNAMVLTIENMNRMNGDIDKLDSLRKERDVLTKERDQLAEDLISLEQSYSTLFRRYEKLRQTSLLLKKNEINLKKAAEDIANRYASLNDKFMLLQNEAQNKLDEANDEILRLSKQNEADLLPLRMKVKQLEARENSLTAMVAAKNKEIIELTTLFEEVIAHAEEDEQNNDESPV